MSEQENIVEINGQKTEAPRTLTEEQYRKEKGITAETLVGEAHEGADETVVTPVVPEVPAVDPSVSAPVDPVVPVVPEDAAQGTGNDSEDVDQAQAPVTDKPVDAPAQDQVDSAVEEETKE